MPWNNLIYRSASDEYGCQYLSERIEDFNTLSNEQQKLLLSLFGYTLERDFLTRNAGVNARISHHTGRTDRFRLSSLLFRTPKPFFSCLNLCLPTEHTPAEPFIDSVRRHYAVSNTPVISSKIYEFEEVFQPTLFSLDIAFADPQGFSLSDKVYHAFLVKIPIDSYEEHRLYTLLKQLGGAKYPSYMEEVHATSDYNLLLKLSSIYGYRLNAHLDMFSPSDTERSVLVVVPETSLELFMQVIEPFEHTQFAELYQGAGACSIGLKGQSISLSSLLVDEIVLQSLNFSSSDSNSTDRLLEEGRGGAPQRRSIRSILDRVDLISPIFLTRSFFRAVGDLKVNTESNHHLSYFAVEGNGRYISSIGSFSESTLRSEGLKPLLRMIYEHHIYFGKPYLATIKLLRSSLFSQKALVALNEITRFFESVSVECSCEVVDEPTIDCSYLLGVGIISKASINIAPVMGGFKQKGSLIYLMDMAEGLTLTPDILHNEEIKHAKGLLQYLIEEGLITTYSPISTGGMFYTLLTLAEKNGLGFDITSDLDKKIDEFLLDDSLGRTILVVSEMYETAVVDYLKAGGVRITLLGHVTKGEMRIDDLSYGFIADLKKKVSFAFQKKLNEMVSKKVVKPYNDSAATKKEQVADMFNNIAHKYDFLNHFLSLGIDKLWRKRLVKEVGKYKPANILDMATGTGDLAIALAKLKPTSIVGLDISVKMVEVGVEKVKGKSLQDVVFLKVGDSEKIDFDTNTFDFATVAFGVRNFENPLLGVSEMYRVLKPGGGIAVLEFAMPTKFPIKQLYKFYFFYILPTVGRFFSKDTSAYTYLPESVEAFPSGKRFTNLMEEAGFKKTRIIPLTFGVANIYIGEK